MLSETFAKMLTRSNTTETLDYMSDLCNTDEDMEWVSSVDRSGLVRITEEANQTFCAIEFSI